MESISYSNRFYGYVPLVQFPRELLTLAKFNKVFLIFILIVLILIFFLAIFKTKKSRKKCTLTFLTYTCSKNN